MAALCAISIGRLDPILFQSVVNLTLTHLRIRQAGVATVYIRYILNGYESDIDDIMEYNGYSATFGSTSPI